MRTSKEARIILIILVGKLSEVKGPKNEPITIPIAIQEQIFHETSFLAKCVKAEANEVKIITHSEVAIALCMASVAEMPCRVKNQYRKGTVRTPPPIPSIPAKNPEASPKRMYNNKKE